MKHSLARTYFEELRETLNILLQEPRLNIFTPLATVPWIIMVFTVAASETLAVPIIAASFSITALTLTYGRKVLGQIRYIVKPLILILLIVFIVSLPLIIFKPGLYVYAFATRVIASTITFIFLLRLIGWRNVLTFLNFLKVPREIVFTVNQTIRFIPLFSNEVLKMLTAREARAIGRHWSIWKTLSSIVSDVVLRSCYRAWVFNLALNARTLNGELVSEHVQKIHLHRFDIYLLLASILIVLLEVLGRLWVGP